MVLLCKIQYTRVWSLNYNIYIPDCHIAATVPIWTFLSHEKIQYDTLYGYYINMVNISKKKVWGSFVWKR